MNHKDLNQLKINQFRSITNNRKIFDFIIQRSTNTNKNMTMKKFAAQTNQQVWKKLNVIEDFSCMVDPPTKIKIIIKIV